MNEEIKGLGVYYDHSTINDKHYFGGYLNLAQNNIDAVFDVLAERNHFDKGKEGIYGLIKECFSDKISDPEFKTRIEFLKQHFPVVQYLDKYDEGRAYFRENLIQLVKSIDKLRGFYTHYFHKVIPFDESFFELIDSIFLSIVMEVKKNKMKDDKTRHLLNKNLKEELNLLFIDKKEKLKKDKAAGKKVSLNDVDIKNAVLNDSFYHLLYKKDAVNQHYSAKYEVESENNITISQSGLLFLLGMFLSKRESEDLRSRVKGFKGKIIKEGEERKSSLKFMATHWVFSHLGYKGVKHRLTTSFQQEGLLIQIIDELSKVPDEVYSTLDEEKQNSFIEDINEYLKEGKKVESLNDSLVVHPVIRKRYEDKFNYFVLRYLDEFAEFPTLRFQIHLGNFVHDRREKEIKGTHFITERVVKEKIKVFGNLLELSNLKTDYVTKIDAENSTGWEIFPNPSYNLVSNNIPIFINLQKSGNKDAKILFGQINQIKSSIKNETRGEQKSSKEQITQLIDEKIKGKKFEKTYIGEPTALLSLNELPALLYELLVNKKTGEEVEEIMINKLIERFGVIQNYNNDDKLPTSQITKNLRKSTTEVHYNIPKLCNAIAKEIAITKEKIALIKDNRSDLAKLVKGKPIRKYVFTTRELGQEATWLADDLKRFMAVECRENLKGYQHNQLQQSLAFFEKKPKEAFDLLKEIWNFDNEKYSWNAWIKHALTKFKNFDDLYHYYLKNRKELFEQLLVNLDSNKDDKKVLRKFLEQQNVWTLFYKRLYTIDSQENQIKKLLSKPLVFPRGIFDEKPTFIHGEKITISPNLFADWYVYSYSSDHQFQRFYNYERDYQELFEKEILIDEEFKENKKQLSGSERFDLFKQKQDLRIKKVKTQDLFLKLIVDDVYQKIFGNSVELSLVDFYLTQEERLKKDREAYQQSQKQEGDKSGNILNDKFIWSKPIPYKEGQINEPNVKLKDIGKFKHFLKNEKVVKLLSYDSTKIWSKQMLDDELMLKPDSYEVIRREHLLKDIHKLEKVILENSSFDGITHPDKFEQKKNPNFKYYMVNGFLRKLDLANEDELKWLLNLNEKTFEEVTLEDLKCRSEIVCKTFLLILIRNKFAHNQLPNKIHFNLLKQYITKSDEGKSYIYTILDFVIQTTTEFKEKLRN